MALCGTAGRAQAPGLDVWSLSKRLGAGRWAGGTAPASSICPKQTSSPLLLSPSLVLVCPLVIVRSDHRQQVTNDQRQVLSYQWGPGGNARGSPKSFITNLWLQR